METLKVFEYDWEIELDEECGWEVASCKELKLAATGKDRDNLLENMKEILADYDPSVPPGEQLYINKAEMLPGLYVLRTLEMTGIPTEEAEAMIIKMSEEADEDDE